MRRTVLVLGDDSRVMLAIARSLGRRGIAVEVGWCVADDPMLRSRYITRVHDLPWYAPNDDSWRGPLLQVLRDGNFSLVLPASEAAVHAFQHHQKRFSDYPVYLLNATAFRVAFDKEQTYALAETLGIPFPETHRCNTDTAERVATEIGFPLIIKPRSSLCDYERINKHFVKKAHSLDDVRQYVGYLASRNASVLLQRCFEGTGVGVELLADHGEILVAFQHKRLHETNGHGSSYRESMPVCDKLLQASAKLMRALNYTGVAMVEFRQQPETGQWRLIEINGRFWGSLPLAVAAGADFPYYLYALLVDERQSFPTAFRSGLRCRALRYDLLWTASWLLGQCRASGGDSGRRLGWTANHVSPWRFFLDTVRGLTLRDHVDSFSWDDPIPVVAEVWRLFRATMARILAPLRASRQI